MIGESDYPTYIVTLGVRLFESYGKKSWILVDFLVDPIIHVYCTGTKIPPSEIGQCSKRIIF